MIFGLLITVLGIGVACALLYYCAVFALPMFIGLSAAFWAMNAGAGLGSVVVGFAAGVIVFLIGQLAFSRSRSLAIRWTIVLLFAVPAAVAGYSLVLQLSEVGVPSLVWRHALAIVGGVMIAFTPIAQIGRSLREVRSGLRSF